MEFHTVGVCRLVILPNMDIVTQVVFVGANSVAVGWRTGQRYYEMRDLLGMNYME